MTCHPIPQHRVHATEKDHWGKAIIPDAEDTPLGVGDRDGKKVVRNDLVLGLTTLAGWRCSPVEVSQKHDFCGCCPDTCSISERVLNPIQPDSGKQPLDCRGVLPKSHSTQGTLPEPSKMKTNDKPASSQLGCREGRAAEALSPQRAPRGVRSGGCLGRGGSVSG